MSKKKLQKFAEIETFKHVFQYNPRGLPDVFEMRGKWNQEFFGNDNPIVLELGCGKGEYSVALAEENPNKNYIGVDIKGARIWRGAKTVSERGIRNVAFLRTKIDNIVSFFAPDEVSEIWIPFPDPQPKKARKRLVSSAFLSRYQQIMKNNGIVHLKTDNLALHEYALALLKQNEIEVIESYGDVYGSNLDSPVTHVQTFYEKMFLAQNMKITYLAFHLDKRMDILPLKE